MSIVVEHLLTNMTGCGCSPFFITGVLSSLGFGELGRQHQKELTENNIAFREKMQKIRDDFSAERLNEQIAFKKESYELGRQFQIHMMQNMNDNRQKEVEFQYLCEKCWPLTIDVRTVMNWQREILKYNGIVPMRVLIAKTDVNTCRKTNGCYENFCTELNRTNIPGLIIEQGCWKSKCQSPMAESLNINYVMQGIPTLIIYPYTTKGTFHLEFATWSFNRGMGAMMLNKAISFPYALANDDDNQKIMLSIEAAIGVVRDNYMVLEYQKPAVYPSFIHQKIKKHDIITNFLQEQYESLYNTIESSEAFKRLCSKTELEEIKSSLNVNHFLSKAQEL